MEPTNKSCWKCKTEKQISDFARSGKDSVCKTCRYELNAEWAKNNREKLRPKRAEYMRQYRARKEAEATAKAVAAPPPVEPPKDPEVK